MGTFSSDYKLYEDFVYSDKTNFDEFAINNSIKNILLTRVGSMVGNAEFGSRIMEVPFNMNDSITHIILKRVIMEALTRWEKRIVFKDVEISRNNANTIDLKIHYYYKDASINSSVSISILNYV